MLSYGYKYKCLSIVVMDYAGLTNQWLQNFPSIIITQVSITKHDVSPVEWVLSLIREKLVTTKVFAPLLHPQSNLIVLVVAEVHTHRRQVDCWLLPFFEKAL